MPMRGEAISVQPPKPILGLVARFARNLSACGHAQADRDSYLAGGINELQLRCEGVGLLSTELLAIDT
jgi:hypothetical protein